MERTEFFDGLNSDEVNDVLERYGNSGWKVKHMGTDRGKFWMLLTVEIHG